MKKLMCLVTVLMMISMFAFSINSFSADEVNNNETLKDAIKTGRFIDNTITEKDAKSSDSHDYR